MTSAWADVVFGLRLLKKSPAFALAAVLTMALGVGVNTAVFSVVNAAILRPLPVPDSHQLVVVARSRPSDTTLRGMSAPALEPYRELTRDAFEDIAGYGVGFKVLSDRDGHSAWVLTTYVTGNYFSTLGIGPAVGRFIRTEEVAAGIPAPIVVLGYNTWQRRFGGDPAIIGRPVNVDGWPVTVVGVAPAGFAGTQSFADSEIYLPLTWREGYTVLYTEHTFGRLLPGASLQAGQAVLDVVAGRLAVDDPDAYARVRFSVVPERLARPLEDLSRWNGLVATVTLALSVLVLGIATVNVMNLVLARSADRRRELAVRAALGAGRGRLTRQLLTEAGLLAVAGSALGVLLGTWTTSALAAVQLPGNKPALLDFSLDDRVLIVGGALTVLTALLIGLAPALDASRTALADAMREGDQRAGTGTRGGSLRKLSIAAQITSCFVLLVAAGLFMRSLAQMEDAPVGFDAHHVLNVGVSAIQAGYDEEHAIDLFRRIEDRVATLPGVESVSFANVVPLGYIRLDESIEIEGKTVSDGDHPIAGFNVVAPDYFSTLRIAIVEGRGFSELDGTDQTRVAIVNQQFATTHWPETDAIGRRFRFSGDSAEWFQVVGITPTGRYHSIAEDPFPFVYLPLSQHPRTSRTLHARTTSPPETLLPLVLQTIRDVEPAVVPIDVMTMEQSLAGGFGFFLPRVTARFAGVLALLAVALAVVGLYGLVSHSASRRTREIGIRMALGATPAHVMTLVVREAILLVGVGVIAGMVAALLAGRFLTDFLVGVSARDPLTFAGVATLLVGVSLAACAIPTLRSVRIDPIAALREE